MGGGDIFLSDEHKKKHVINSCTLWHHPRKNPAHATGPPPDAYLINYLFLYYILVYVHRNLVRKY